MNDFSQPASAPEADRDQKLVSLHAQLSAAMLERGLRHAAQHTPDEFKRANDLLKAGMAHFQLRIDLDGPAAKTSGWLLDNGGEPVACVFEIAAIAPAGTVN